MTNSNPNAGARLPTDSLLAHAGGLRALAYDLLGDANAAEDVLQDTFVRALVSPPPHQQSDAGVRAWLRTVVRGVALNRRRNEAHRTERETRYVRDREVQEHDERGELLRAVVDAVLALDEPYRGVVLARYFEGLSTSEIAARTNTPVATVASRLQRAHRELRTRLEGEAGPRGGLTHALWMLVGAPASAPSGSAAEAAPHAAPRAPLASTQTLVAATLLVAAGVLAFVWQGASGDDAHADVSRAAPPARVDAGAVATTGALEAGVGAAPARANGVVTSSAAAEEIAGSAGVRGAGPHVYELEIGVRGDDGAPSVGTALYGAPHGQPLVRLGVTGFDGQLALTWRAFEPELAFVFSTDARQHELVRAQLHAGVPEHVALVRPDARALFLRVEALRARFVSESPGTNALFAARSSVELGGTPAPDFTRDEFGNGVFVDPFLTPILPRSDVPILSQVPIVGQMFRSRDRIENALTLRARSTRSVLADDTSVQRAAESETAASELSELRGVVRDAAGRPVAGAALVVACAAGRRAQLVADERGAFTCTHLPRGAALITSSADASLRGDYAEVRVALDAPHVDTELVLAPRNALRVHLVDERGEPLAAWRVEAEPVSDPRAAGAAAVTDADGRAVLAPRGSGPFRMLARHAGGALVPAQLVADNVWPQSAELELPVAGGHANGEIAFAFRSRTGRAHDDGEVWLWRVDSGRGVVVPRANAEVIELPDGNFAANFALRGLAPGRYVLEGGAHGAPWSELMTIGVGPNAHMPLELGTDEPRAELDVHLTDAQQREGVSGVIEIVRNGVLVRSPEFTSDLPAVLAIPEGAGTLVWTRSIVREEVVEHARPALTSQTFGEVIDGTTREVRAGALTSTAASGTPERHVFTGRPDARTTLELAPLGAGAEGAPRAATPR